MHAVMEVTGHTALDAAMGVEDHSGDQCTHLASLRWIEFSHIEPCYNKRKNQMVTPSPFVQCYWIS